MRAIPRACPSIRLKRSISSVRVTSSSCATDVTFAPRSPQYSTGVQLHCNASWSPCQSSSFRDNASFVLNDLPTWSR
uniref:Uncharacterized protein n=1 Tax=Thermomicrobium roseum TaxID=500 RepID=A0A7C1XSC8_THERO